MSDFRLLLLEISNEITNADLAKLKFLCEDVIPSRTAEGISQPFELFRALAQRNLLSEQNREFLASKLSDVNRIALRNKLLGIQEDTPIIAEQQNEMEALRQRNLQLAEREVAPGNNDREGVPGEERQPFPRLHEMESALSNIRRWEPPLPTMGSGLGGVQEQVEPSTTPDLTSSPTRVPKFGGTFATVEREPLSYEAPSGEGSNETDFADGGPGVTEPLQTSIQVATLRSQLHLDRDGAFLDPKKYDPIKRLGSGGFAKVYMVRNRTTGKISACKMFDLGENDERIQEKTKMVETEVRILSALKHRFIVEFYHTDQGHNTFLIFMECMEGGSVEKLLRDKGPLKEPVVQKFTWQLLEAVDFLHNQPTNPVIHKDIKGANILLDKPHENIKLADFGISTIMQELRTATGGNFTRTHASFYWASPELLANKGFGRNTDIWSVGCTVIEMLTTKPPLLDPENKHLDDNQRMFKITNLEVRPPKICSPLAFQFIDQCLRGN